MREADQIFPEEVILSELSPVIHQYTVMGVVPALQRITHIEHPFPVMVAWHYQHVHRSDLAAHIDQLYQQFPTFAEGLLPASTIHRTLSCPVDVEEIVAQREQYFRYWYATREPEEFMDRPPSR